MEEEYEGEDSEEEEDYEDNEEFEPLENNENDGSVEDLELNEDNSGDELGKMKYLFV